jgi:hypothetical protein
MTPQTMSFIFGALLLAVGILGGGFEVKEIKISNVSASVRIFSALVGVVFVILGLSPQSALTGLIPGGANAVVSEREPDKGRLDVPPVAHAGWQFKNFPPPNAGGLAFEITAGGNPACASYDGRNCLWGKTLDQINFASSWNRVGDFGLVSRLCLLRSNPSVRSAPSFHPDLHVRSADARSGGQGWPAFGPPLQRREASLTAASTAA